MVIKGVYSADNKMSYYMLRFEDESEIKVTASQIADFNLYAGRELTDEEYTEIISGLKIAATKARALRILGNRSLSAKEINKRLIKKGEPVEAAQSTVDWLEETGLIDDAEYAKSIVSHYNAKGYGSARLKDEFFRRGIPRDMWDEALEDLNIADIEAAVDDYLNKKLKGSMDNGDLRRASDSMVRRGYSYEQAKSAISRYTDRIRGSSEP
jgi:regulatory protein